MKSMSKNVGLAFMARIISMISGLVIQRYILVAYGSTYNGLTSAISQVLSYLVLLEAGLSSASIQALYKPLSEDDWNEASSIVKATEVSYRHVAYIFCLLLIGVSLLIPIIVSREVDLIVAGLLTFVTGLSQVTVYFLGGKYISLLTADRKIYIRYLVNLLCNVLSAIVRVFALQNGASIVAVQFVHFIIVILENVLLIVYVKSKYKRLNMSVSPAFKAIGKRWSVLIHTIAGMIVNHTDVVLLTIFDSLKTVSIYSVYNNIFVQISNIIQNVFLQAPQGNFGILYAKNKKEYNKIYIIFETFYTIFLFVIVSLGMVLALSFVSIYTSGIEDSQMYTKKFLPILFSLILLMNQIRVPSLITINCVGAYKETQFGAILEAVINLSVSLILYFLTPLGMYGMLIGTITSYMYRTTDVIVYAYRYLLNKKVSSYVRLLASNILAFALTIWLFFIKFPITADNYFVWLLKALESGFLIVIIFTLINIIINFKEMKSGIFLIISIIKKKKMKTV